ncbi:hypothetical protein F4814DRAFT_2000 [Daldinia grandis]|nr:hypothetical protein F4814DRAFT_2000 [Daldinia grandis]
MVSTTTYFDQEEVVTQCSSYMHILMEPTSPPRCIHLLFYGTLGTVQKYFGVILLSTNQLNKTLFFPSYFVLHIIHHVSNIPISFLPLAAPVLCIM